ncbi:MAG: hypothetical protein ACNA8K_05470 [Cyclonatronaceae bacterium]
MTASEKISSHISILLNPFFLSPLLFILLASQMSVTAFETALVVSMAILFYTVLPLFILYGFKRRKLIISYDVPVRSNRNKPFVLGLCSYALGLAVFVLLPFQSAWIYAAISAAMLVNGGLSALINLIWKISMHANGIASFSAGLLFLTAAGFLDPLPGYPVVLSVLLFLVTAAVTGARIILKAHTPGQAVGGAFFGWLLTTGQLWLYLQ